MREKKSYRAGMFAGGVKSGDKWLRIMRLPAGSRRADAKWASEARQRKSRTAQTRARGASSPEFSEKAQKYTSSPHVSIVKNVIPAMPIFHLPSRARKMRVRVLRRPGITSWRHSVNNRPTWSRLYDGRAALLRPEMQAGRVARNSVAVRSQ